MKFLVIRFSSIGDVTQALSIPSKIAEKYNTSQCKVEIHFAVRSDISEVVQGHPAIDRIWILPRAKGSSALWKMIQELRLEKFTHIYDAHNSIRSRLICLFLTFPIDLSRLFSPPKIVRKSRKRWKRFLLFNLRIDTYEKPLSGQRDLLEPLQEWSIDSTLPSTPQMTISASAQKSWRSKNHQFPSHIKDFITLAPSAAYELKRWPKEYFIDLVKALPDRSFILLGGPNDTFIDEIHQASPQNTWNFSGRLSLAESAAAIGDSQGLVSNDTGLLHFAEQLGKQCIALMGPAPFGFPSREKTFILERNLPCRPCSKHGQGPCTNPQFHQCLRDIHPTEVREKIELWQ